MLDSNTGEDTLTAMEQVPYLERKVYDNEIIAMVKRKNTLKSNIQKVYSLILGQCTELMKDKLKASTKWQDIQFSHNALELLIDLKYSV